MLAGWCSGAWQQPSLCGGADTSGMRRTDVTLVLQISDWKGLEMATSRLWGCNNGSAF